MRIKSGTRPLKQEATMVVSVGTFNLNIQPVQF